MLSCVYYIIQMNFLVPLLVAVIGGVCALSRKAKNPHSFRIRLKQNCRCDLIIFGQNVLTFSTRWNDSICHVSSPYLPFLRYFLYTLRSAKYEHSIKMGDMSYFSEKLIGFNIYVPKSHISKLEKCVEFAINSYKWKFDENDDYDGYSEALAANNMMRDWFREEEINSKIRIVIPWLIRLLRDCETANV